MSVNVEEISTRVVPAPPSGEPGQGRPEPQLGAVEDSWAATYRLVQRESRRTAAQEFDD